MPKREKDIVAVLCNVRSALNVGSMFRTADAAGISKIYLTGYTPAPTDRFGRKVHEIHKTALGAENFVPWEHKTNTTALLKKLKADGYEICAIEQSKKSLSLNRYKASGPTVLIVGNEVRGLQGTVLKRADKILEIPMMGKKESLNVSVAFGVVAFFIAFSNTKTRQ